MPKNWRTYRIYVAILFVPVFGFSQTAGCVHGSGISYILDAYLASMGACNCQKEGVILFNMPSCPESPYILDFEDEFEGNALDTTKWGLIGYAQGASADGQNIEYNSLDNVEVYDGICHIVGKKETVMRKLVNWKDSSEILADGLPNFRRYDYTSSNIWTKRKFFHGKFEIRCRLPKGNGFWPAFWLFGGKRWNEIDIFDNYAGIDKLVSSIGHDYDGDGKATGCSKDITGFDFSDWHKVSCSFEFDKIEIFVDDVPVRVINRIVTNDGLPVNCGDNLAQGTYYFLKSYPIEQMQMVLDLALTSHNGPGGSKPVDETTPFPSAFEIDYVRVWKRSPGEIFLNVQPNPVK
jgi:hypothetical protein